VQRRTTLVDYCKWCHQTAGPQTSSGQAAAIGKTKAVTCPQCHSPIKLITISDACEIVSKCRQTLYRWIENGQVSTMRSANGQQLVCLSSLFIPDEAGQEQDSLAENNAEEFDGEPSLSRASSS